MQCRKIYEPGDEAVRAGVFKVGEQCTQYMASEEMNGFCRGHYNQWLKVNGRQEELTKIKDKRVATVAKQKLESATKNAQLTADAKENPEEYGINKSIIRALGLDQDVYLENELALYKALPMGDGQENYAEKMAFARWLSTSEVKRHPQDIGAVANILGCTIQTIELWRRSPEIARFRRTDAESMLENAFALVAYKTLEGVDRLDPRYIKIYNDMIEKISDGKSNSKFPKLSESLIQQALKNQETSGMVHMQGSLNKIEKSTVFGLAGDGKFEVNN